MNAALAALAKALPLVRLASVWLAERTVKGCISVCCLCVGIAGRRPASVGRFNRRMKRGNLYPNRIATRAKFVLSGN